MFASKQGFNFIVSSFGNSAFWSNTISYTEYLSTTSTTNLIDIKNSNGYTLEYWIYPTEFNFGGETNVGPGNYDTLNNYWSFGPYNSFGFTNILQFYFYDNILSTSRSIVTNNNALIANSWQNISVITTTTSGNTTFNLYINGNRQQVALSNNMVFGNNVTVSSNNLYFDTSLPFRIGSSGTNYLVGYVDEIRVSNIARYSGANYTLSTTPFNSDANTQLLIQCNGANGSTVFTDSSSFNRTITNNSNLVTISNVVTL